ncbi:MAG: aconitase X catalytic domain-containing protein [Archaeoglobaceae archaeon]|nr:aconitase X catalytic domain-containing protein [Archaeoglobaceae archaeon]MDW8117941.1 aconitase X catalytic domain-containing protein [Archaeoglobaceae archaeon]
MLTKEEELLLENEETRECMKIVLALAKVFEAKKLVKITSAHISGVSYDNIGDEGLEWLRSIKGKVVVPTTLNPAGMDLERWKEMGIGEEFYKKQMEIIEVFKRLGVEITLTCTPYYIQKPKIGEHLAWAESSAVVYANSLLGARTNRESGISALASAITGRTPYYGLHIKENRAPTVVIKARGDLSLVGYKVGLELPNEIPYFLFDRKVSLDELKLLSASLAASGNIAMFHAEELTPEWRDFEKPKEVVEIEGKIEKGCEPQLIAIGCPHCSKEELKEVLRLIGGRKVRKELWIFTSRKVAEESREIVKKLENLGAKVFKDTCMVVSPVTEKFECVMVNSGKALEYLPKKRGVEVSFGDLKACVEAALS